jgi:peptidoglycan/xylan/chitin deacetylase (PgdA/CDA1 family)
MKNRKYIYLTGICLILLFESSSNYNHKDKPKIALSFDDPHTEEIIGIKGEDWNDMIINHLDSANLQAIVFVHSRLVNNKEGKAILQKLDSHGHYLGNHTANHVDYNKEHMTLQKFVAEIRTCDSLISGYENYRKIIRFPFLRAGNSIEKRDSLRNFMKANGYKHGWVTIDNSDWYIKNRIEKRYKTENDYRFIDEYKTFYLNHIFERAEYYNKLSKVINRREVPHILLLHYNITSALFLDDLIKKFEDEGWEWVDYSEAIQDGIYNRLPNAMPSDQSLIWSQAKESGLYESVLRYPAEDGRYEKAEMDSLGL